MEMKYILYSKVHKTTDAGETWTFKFQPVTIIRKSLVSFSVTTTDPFGQVGILELPRSIGDTVMLDVTEKNVQGKLPGGKKA